MSDEERYQSLSLEDIFERHIDRSHDLDEIFRILYGGQLERMIFAANNPLIEKSPIVELSVSNNFELAGYYIKAKEEQNRSARLVRIGLIQHKIQLPTDTSVMEQIVAMHNRIRIILDAAALAKVNIVCLQEAWTMPFAFCTGQKFPWIEFAESAEEGLTTRFLQEYASRHNMVIISPILERDSTFIDTVWNTAIIIDNHGRYMGKTRKNHISRKGDFNETIYYDEGNMGHPVFETEFGRIAVNICYGRHHPLNWLMYKINGAEIVFNPSSTVDSIGEHLWPIEARNAAIANSYYTCAINRVGTETFLKDFDSEDIKPRHRNFGYFYGSSYITAPDGRRTPGLSRIYDGLLIAEIDLNLCSQASDNFGFQMTSRLEDYSEKLNEAVKPTFMQQIIPPEPFDDKSSDRKPVKRRK